MKTSCLATLLLLLLQVEIKFCFNESTNEQCILLVLPDEVSPGSMSLSWVERNSSLAANIQLCTISGRDASYNTMSRLAFNEVHRDDNTCSAVIGVVGELDSQAAAILHTLANRTNRSITLVASSTPPTSLPVSYLDLPNILDFNPLEHYVAAMAGLMDQLSWTRIGLITDDAYYHLYAAEVLQKQLFINPERTIAPYARLAKTNLEDMGTVLRQFNKYGTKIAVVIGSKELECLILRSATKTGFKWPEYAIVLLDLEQHGHPRACPHIKGVIILINSMHSCKTETNAHRKNLCNMYTSLLQDSILAAASAQAHNISNASFKGSTGTLKFRRNKLLTNISILQVQGGSANVVGSYNSHTEDLQLHPSKLAGGTVPSGSLVIVDARASVLHTCLVLLTFAFSFVFITINLILYFAFRKEPEVKATSVSVSMCMFLSCYLLILFLPLLLIEGEPIAYTKTSATFLCTVLVWFSTGGISFSLIFATLFVKMLRVYFIFSNPFAYRKKLFSNPALFVYILIIVSPTVCILIFIAALDEFTKISVMNKMKSHTFVFDLCQNRHTILWGLLLFTYNAVLVLSSAILAIASSSIRYKNFGDTKATNAFTYLSIFNVFMTTVYWYFFRSLPISKSSVDKTGITLYIGHAAEALLCQLLLFVPKVFPPTMRWLRDKVLQDKVRHK